MTEIDLYPLFEDWWHNCCREQGLTRNFKKNFLSYGRVHYVDVMQNLAWRAFKAGYYRVEQHNKWYAYPAKRPDDLDCAYIVLDKDGNEHRTHADLVDNDTVTASIAAFIAVPNVIAFRKVT